MLLPPVAPSELTLASVAESLGNRRVAKLGDLASQLQTSLGETAAAVNELALRGQVICDLHAGVFRWRQVLPMALSDRELGPPHPEADAARKIIAQGSVVVETKQPGPRGGSIVAGKAENKPCEALVDGDGVIRKGRCLCGWHNRYGIRNGPCRHIQALRDLVWMSERAGGADWYADRPATSTFPSDHS